MNRWKFWDYYDKDGKNLIGQWYLSQEVAVQETFDWTLYTLSATQDWTDKRVDEFRVLTGRHLGLCEIRFDLVIDRMKRRFRPTGIWRPIQRDFILLLGCEKSGRIYKPQNAFDVALDYKRRFEQGEGRISEHI
jgi:hypothetical protein